MTDRQQDQARVEARRAENLERTTVRGHKPECDALNYSYACIPPRPADCNCGQVAGGGK